MSEERLPRPDRLGRREFIAVLVLSVTAVITAWSGFQAAKWGGQMSIAFTDSSAARIEAARLDSTANERRAVHIVRWTQYVTALGDQNSDLADFLQDQFPEPLARAHQDWLATDPVDSADGTSPFDMPAYVLEERVAARAADARADQRFADAVDNNQRSDNWTMLTVLFAVVLFFAAMSGRMARPRSQWALLIMAIAILGAGLGLALVLPNTV